MYEMSTVDGRYIKNANRFDPAIVKKVEDFIYDNPGLGPYTIAHMTHLSAGVVINAVNRLTYTQAGLYEDDDGALYIETKKEINL